MEPLILDGLMAIIQQLPMKLLTEKFVSFMKLIHAGFILRYRLGTVEVSICTTLYQHHIATLDTAQNKPDINAVFGFKNTNE